jgi:hypothetical protein
MTLMSIPIQGLLRLALLAPSLLAVSLLAACATPPEKFPPELVAKAAQDGSLPALYDEIEASLQEPGLSDQQRQTRELRLKEAGRTLAQGAEKEIEAAVQAGTLPDGLAPLRVYEAQDSRLKSIERWDPATYQRVSATLNDARKATEAAINAKEAALNGLAESQVEEKLAAMEEIGALYGVGTDEQVELAEQRGELLAELRLKANKAIENEDYDGAQRMLSAIAAVSPQDAAVDDKLVEVDAKLFEQKFYDALANDRPDDAYQALVTLSESSNFEKIRPRLASSADVMADHFVTLGASASDSGQWANAFRWFMQSRDIRARLGLSTPTNPPQEQKLVQEMQRRFKKAREKDMPGLAWGYLNVIIALQPDAPTLRRDLRETREEVLQHAVRRVSAAPFEDHHRSDSEFGDTVTAEIVRYLYNHLSEDVRIIEREKLAAIEQERGLAGEADALKAVDYLIQGNILEAKVDSTERRLPQRKRVVTGQETVPNPEFERWRGMNKKEREAADLATAPPATITRDKVEDVEFEQVYHRKVGVFSVSYRVIDADSAKVIFADTQRSKMEREGTDSPPIDIGSFQQKAEVATLPTDAEILEQLAEEISETIGQKLSEVMVNPEIQYEADGDRFVRENNFVEAVTQYAYAMVLSERKQKDVASLTVRLRDSAVAASPHD